MSIYKIAFPVLLLLTVIGAAVPVSASVSEGDDPWTRPQLGVWFGPITPVGYLNREIDTYLGGGAYGRYPVFEYGTLGADVSYQRYPSDTLNQLTVIPMYGNFIFRLPINFPLSFTLKAGAGAAWVSLEPEKRSQYDPLFMTGFEMYFPAGSIVNVGMRIDYLYMWETYRAGAKHDGYVVNAGLTLFFNLDI